MSHSRNLQPGFSPHRENRPRSETAELGFEGMNAPDRFELFTLEEGEKKCTEDIDTRTPNTSIFTINKEDHTIANLVRAALLKDKRVLFAAYKVPHPLFAKLILRVQTNGEITPKEAVIICSSKVVQNLGQLAQEFTKEYQLRKMVNNGGNDN